MTEVTFVHAHVSSSAALRIRLSVCLAPCKLLHSLRSRDDLRFGSLLPKPSVPAPRTQRALNPMLILDPETSTAQTLNLKAPIKAPTKAPSRPPLKAPPKARKSRRQEATDSQDRRALGSRAELPSRLSARRFFRVVLVGNGVPLRVTLRVLEGVSFL